MEMIKFNYDGKNVTTITDKNGDYWFVAAHICKILNHSNPSQAVRDNCDSKGVRSTDTLTKGGLQNMKLINEPNLYRLIFKSKLKNAKEFQNWVYEEVLPSLRKTGKYSIPEKLTIRSIKNRTILTDAWKECGIEKPYHFIQLTLQEYKSLGFNKDKRKKNMSREEILLLSALESMETLNLFYDKKDGYYECKNSLQGTAQKVIENTIKKEIK